MRLVLLIAVWMVGLLGFSSSHAETLYYYQGTTRQPITRVEKRLTSSTLATRSANPSTPPPAFPLFREGDSPAGRLMGLAGGIIVQFQPHWTVNQITEWLAARGLPLGERLEIQGNWYSIPTPAGDIALETANQLHESGEVISATPNWWKAMAGR